MVIKAGNEKKDDVAHLGVCLRLVYRVSESGMHKSNETAWEMRLWSFNIRGSSQDLWPSSKHASGERRESRMKLTTSVRDCVCPWNLDKIPEETFFSSEIDRFSGWRAPGCLPPSFLFKISFSHLHCCSVLRILYGAKANCMWVAWAEPKTFKAEGDKTAGRAELPRALYAVIQSYKCRYAWNFTLGEQKRALSFRPCPIVGAGEYRCQATPRLVSQTIKQ